MVQGIVPKAVISAYLSFFPVVVGMVKGLRSPDSMKLDLLRTYNASNSQGFWKLRLPASMPYLFASLKIGIAASLVGAIVGELPTGAVAGLGAVLMDQHLCQTEEETGALVRLNDIELHFGGYYLATNQRAGRRRAVRAVRKWLLQEALYGNSKVNNESSAILASKASAT